MRSNLRIIESKVGGIHEEPPAEYLSMATSRSGRCLYCGHPTNPNKGGCGFCVCIDCVCCKE